LVDTFAVNRLGLHVLIECIGQTQDAPQLRFEGCASSGSIVGAQNPTDTLWDRVFLDNRGRTFLEDVPEEAFEALRYEQTASEVVEQACVMKQILLFRRQGKLVSDEAGYCGRAAAVSGIPGS
jgi:hypothetical protein